MNWLFWEFVGGIGQGLLLLRWIVQFYATKKAGIGRTPMMFWILTLMSSLISLPYTLHLGSIVFLFSFCFMVWLSLWNINVERRHWSWKQEKEDLIAIKNAIFKGVAKNV